MHYLNITEIYPSVQGESSFAGLPCTFVRLTGCPLRCRWCDTAYAFHGGRSLGIDEILAEVKKLGINLVELTGGEPLAQEHCPTLAKGLVAQGYRVLIETSGSEPVDPLPPEVHIIMDLKCPGSGMADRNLWSNLSHLKPSDEIKMVVRDRVDFDWAESMIAEHDLSNRFRVLLSPAWGLLDSKELVAWMLERKVNARLNLQLHKYIWHPRAKGV
jgi:7-carboxy-7-deazaguanine synthase